MRQFEQRFQQVGTQYNAGGDIHLHQSPLSLTERQRKRNRTLMLERVQTIWIAGVLEPSLQGVAPLVLDLESKPSATVTPFWQVLREFDRTRPLPQGLTTLVHVYDHAAGEVLILGEPGAGKTTLLLELTRDLLERARQDEGLPMPVVFNLSSWALVRQPFDQWLVRELHLRYQIPVPLATSWIESDQVLPLLDGLDEVVAVHREACIAAINAYRQAHGLLSTVVCCRQADYLALSTRLLLRTAVVVQSLTQEQIESYLESGGEQLAALRQTLHEDADLQALASTPLMLNVLIATQEASPQKEITVTGSREAKRAQILATYVERMLTHRSSGTRYTPEQTIHWLTFLAQQMKRQSQSIFYLEQIQPGWLAAHWMFRLYDWLTIRLPGVLMGILFSFVIGSFVFSLNGPLNDPRLLIGSMLLGGLLGGLLSRESAAPRPILGGEQNRRTFWLRLAQRLLLGVFMGVSFGLLYALSKDWSYGQSFGQSFGQSVGVSVGLSIGLCSILLQVLLGKSQTAVIPSHTSSPMQEGRWPRLIRRRAIRKGILAGLLIGLSIGLSIELRGGAELQYYGHYYGLSSGLSSGMTGGFLSLLLIGRSTQVQLTDRLIWSWKSLGRSLLSKRHGIATLQVMALIALGIGLIYVPLSVLMIAGLTVGLAVGLSYWLLIGLIQGVSSETIEDQHRVLPNQGIRRSVFNGLVLGLISALLSGLIVWLSKGLSIGLYYYRLGSQLPSWLYYGLPLALNSGVSAGLSLGLLVGLLNGGLASFRHYVLRFLLWREGLLPWHTAPFLDYAASCILLRKVGGGYIFLHRILLEHFAGWETAAVGDAAVEGTQTSTPVPASSSNVESSPSVLSVLPDSLAPTVSPASPDTPSEAPRLLPCGHEMHTANARFCSLCGASIK